jgi:hypothetical protein
VNLVVNAGSTRVMRSAIELWCSDDITHAGPGKTPVPRLSIVIPCAQDAVFFESTLASVLQNRPADCEVLVVQPRAYDDPYDLRAEVRFLQAPAESSTVDLINLGIESAAGTIVHVLSCDVEVIDGWTEPALVHFDDPTLGSVSPLVVGEDGGKVVARGVLYAAGGRRKLRLRGPSRWRARSCHVVGPTLAAGFYGRQAVLDVGGFCCAVGEELADVDLAFALRAIGLRAVHEENSVVMSRASAAVHRLSFRHGRQAERLFWRNAAASGWWRALLLHCWTVAGELVSNPHRPTIVPQLLGRALATCEFADYRRHHRQLQAILAAAQQSSRSVLPFKRSRDAGCQALLHPRAAA